MTISIPATSANLGPGFDCLGLSLDFRNYFNITPSAFSSIQIVGEGEGVPKFRVDNMFVKIFKKTLADFNITPLDYRFYFKNHIPISRGMGSSSAVIVGAISAAHYLAKKTINHKDILNASLVYESHPDNITPAVYGGFNVAIVDKKCVFNLKEEIPENMRAVMVIPNRSISTKYSRQTLPKKYSTTDSVFNLSRSSLMSLAFAQKKWDLLRLVSKDRFHQDRRMRQFPILFNVQKTALENGALMSTLSGSGSSFFNMCFEDDANQISNALSKKFPHFRVFILKFDNEGIRVEEE